MSQKIPVGEVINEAVQFGMHRWPAFIRFAWAPIIVLGLFAAGLSALVFDVEAVKAMDEATEAGQMPDFNSILKIPLSAALAALGVWIVISFYLLSGVYASIYRLVALGEEKPGILHLRTDGPALRVFLAMLILMIIGLLIWVAGAVAGSVMTGQSLFGSIEAMSQSFNEIMSAANKNQQPDPELLETFGNAMAPWLIGLAVALIPSLYINVKLMPFPAGSAAEDRLVLFKTFNITFGHWWAMFGSLILLIIFAMILGIIVAIAGGIFELVAAFLTGQGGAMAAIGGVLWFAVAIAQLLFQAFVTCVQLAVQAIVYRRLETGE